MKFLILMLASGLFDTSYIPGSIKLIKLESRTRGYHEIIEVKQDLSLTHIVVSPQRSINDTLFIDSNLWEELVQLTVQIQMSEIPSLIAPSNKSRTDLALIQTLVVQCQNGESILSQNYDKGNPPRAIIPLVVKIEAMVDK